jgi:ubiquinol-cytochrome c reductase cytochrome b subunit
MGLVRREDADSVGEEWRKHASEYYAPKNFNFWYYFGVLSMFVLVIQIVTGIFLTMNYKPDAALAFGSVEYIMRDVPGGWILRYMHSTGASAFFIVVYLHMFRACCTAPTRSRASWCGFSACSCTSR